MLFVQHSRRGGRQAGGDGQGTVVAETSVAPLQAQELASSRVAGEEPVLPSSGATPLRIRVILTCSCPRMGSHHALYLLTPCWTANPTRRGVRSRTSLKPHNSAPGMREQRSPSALHRAAPWHGRRSSVALPLLALPRVCHPTRNEHGPRASLCNSPGTPVVQNEKQIRGAPPQATLTDFPGFSGKLRTALSSLLD